MPLGQIQKGSGDLFDYGHIRRSQKSGKGPAETAVFTAFEGPSGSRVHHADVEIPIQFHDGVHGAVEQSGQFFLPGSNLGIRPQSQQFGGGPGGEDAEYRQVSKGFGHGLCVHHRDIAQNSAFGIDQGKPEIADRAEFGQVRIPGKQFDDVFGDMQECFVFNGRFTGRAFDVVFIMPDKRIPQPKGQGAKSLGFGKVFGDPGPVGAQGLAQVFDHRPEKPRTGFGCGAVHQGLQQQVFV